MPAKRVLVSLGIASAFVSCGAPSSVAVGPGQMAEVQLQPAVVPPNQKGALALGVVTGCVFEFLGRAEAERTFRFQVRPSQRVPEFNDCIDRLRDQPGVDGVAIP